MTAVAPSVCIAKGLEGPKPHTSTSQRTGTRVDCTAGAHTCTPHRCSSDVSAGMDQACSRAHHVHAHSAATLITSMELRMFGALPLIRTHAHAHHKRAHEQKCQKESMYAHVLNPLVGRRISAHKAYMQDVRRKVGPPRLAPTWDEVPTGPLPRIRTEICVKAPVRPERPTQDPPARTGVWSKMPENP